jgi:transcriptional regulator with XRE-family HTH domain
MRFMILPGPTLKESRLAAGLTQAELARRLETTQSAVARLEAPEANPRFDTFQRAVAATGNALRIDLEQSTYPPLDETMIVENLRRSPGERLRYFTSAYAGIRQLAPTVRGRSE